MGRLVSSEVLKIRTTRSWWGVLIGLVVWTALLTMANAATAGLEFAPGQASPGTEDASVARGIYTSGLSGFGYVFALVLGVLVIGTEFRHQTVTPTFLGTPRRARLVLAKWLASAVFGLLYGLVALATSVVVAVVVLSIRGLDLGLGGDGVVRAMVLSLVPYVLWTIMGVGLGTLVRNQVVAMVVGVVTIVVELIASGILSAFFPWTADVFRWFPRLVTTAITSPYTGPGADDLLIDPTLAVVVLLAYGLLFGGLGALVTLRRDVT